MEQIAYGPHQLRASNGVARSTDSDPALAGWPCYNHQCSHPSLTLVVKLASTSTMSMGLSVKRLHEGSEPSATMATARVTTSARPSVVGALVRC